MQNEVWDRVIGFLNQLRGENRSRKSLVHIQEVTIAQQEEEFLCVECRKYIENLPTQEQQKIEEWQEKLEKLHHLQEQEAYCQGYVDCIYLLSGLGLLEQDTALDNLIERINQ